MGAFVSGTAVASGANYTPSSGTDNMLVWMPYSYRSGTTTGSSQTFGGTSMTEDHDLTDNMSGGADTAANLCYLKDAGTSSQTLSLSWSSGVSFEDGYALTLENIDQTTPYVDSDSLAISGHTDSLNYTAAIGDVAVYWKFFGGSTNPSWTAPTGFTQRYTDTVITSPAYRIFRVYTRDVDSTETATAVGANTSGGSVFGGLHGVIVFKGAAVGGGGIQIFRRRIEG